MHSRLIRVLLVFVALAAGATAAFFLQTTDSELSEGLGSSSALREDARALSEALTVVRTGQAAYVAPGQGGDFWLSRVSKQLPGLDQRLSAFKTALGSSAAQTALDPALAAVENFHKLDIRAREYVRSGETLMASDLIFSDGIEAMTTAQTQVDAALKAELEARDAYLAGLRAREFNILAASSGGILLLLAMLGFTAAETNEPVFQPIRENVKPMTPAPMPVTVKTRVANISVAAQLCTDLARVLDSKQLPALLERTAKVINASGIVVWMADAAGKELRPACSFGYADQIVARMGAIPSDASNAAASSYRAAEMRTAAGEGSKNGALVTPILTANGCIGVLSAEMKGGSENEESSQALASIVAAQLATILSAPIEAPALPLAAEG